jgi:hypothetical protein
MLCTTKIIRKKKLRNINFRAKQAEAGKSQLTFGW